MGYNTLESNAENQWESAHVCPACGHPTLLKELELGEATTGIISCPKCPWAGQINIQIIEWTERE
jgi:ribosomal protein L37AE/L43A